MSSKAFEWFFLTFTFTNRASSSTKNFRQCAIPTLVYRRVVCFPSYSFLFSLTLKLTYNVILPPIPSYLYLRCKLFKLFPNPNNEIKFLSCQLNKISLRYVCLDVNYNQDEKCMMKRNNNKGKAVIM